ncbi:unnamed protein product [Symbiodinium microadriaticum]|nr:unnamed protein product [Symbiodinium microadriaticum]
MFDFLQPKCLIITDMVLFVGVFLMIVIGFASNQWAVATFNCGCDDDCYVFIGPFQAKYSKFGKCDDSYKVESIDCDDLDLNGDDCDSFETSTEAANIALALAVLLLVYKAAVTGCSFIYIPNRTKTLWIMMVIDMLGDVVLGMCALISAGQFDEAMDEFNVKKANGDKVNFDTGLGYGLFVGGGLLAWICAAVTAVTLWRGLKPKETEAEADSDNVK